MMIPDPLAPMMNRRHGLRMFSIVADYLLAARALEAWARRGGYQGRALALPVDLKVAEPTDIEPKFGGSLYETQQDAPTGIAPHNNSWRVGIDRCFPEDADSAAVLALTDRCNDVDAEQFPQLSCGRVPVKMRYWIACGSGDVLVLEARVLSTRGSGTVAASHRRPPVPPKRSVLIEAVG